MPDELFVNSECFHSANALSMVAKAPTVMRNNMKITEVDYKNAPANVTAVPTLVKQDGTMLVGAQVFDYLKRGRKDPHFPPTDVDSFEYYGAPAVFRGPNKYYWMVGVVLAGLAVAYYLKSRGYPYVARLPDLPGL